MKNASCPSLFINLETYFRTLTSRAVDCTQTVNTKAQKTVPSTVPAQSVKKIQKKVKYQQ